MGKEILENQYLVTSDSKIMNYLVNMDNSVANSFFDSNSKLIKAMKYATTFLVYQNLFQGVGAQVISIANAGNVVGTNGNNSHIVPFAEQPTPKIDATSIMGKFSGSRVLDDIQNNKASISVNSSDSFANTEHVNLGASNLEEIHRKNIEQAIGEQAVADIMPSDEMIKKFNISTYLSKNVPTPSEAEAREILKAHGIDDNFIDNLKTAQPNAETRTQNKDGTVTVKTDPVQNIKNEKEVARKLKSLKEKIVQMRQEQAAIDERKEFFKNKIQIDTDISDIKQKELDDQQPILEQELLQVQNEMENISKDVQELEVKYSEGSRNERVLMTNEEKIKLVDVISENYNAEQIINAMTDRGFSLFSNLLLPANPVCNKTSHRGHIISKEWLKDFLKTNLNEYTKKEFLQEMVNFASACNDTAITNNTLTMEKLQQDLAKMTEQYNKEMKIFEDKLENCFGKDNQGEIEAEFNSIKTKADKNAFDTTYGEYFSYTEFDHKNLCYKPDNTLRVNYYDRLTKQKNTIDKIQSSLRINSFDELVKKCIDYANSNDCDEFIAGSILWNPGNILIAPKDTMRLKSGGNNYPESNIDTRSLLALKAEYFTLIKNIVYGINAEGRLNTENVKTNNTFFINNEDGRIKLLTQAADKYENTADFFKEWTELCKASNGQFLTQDAFDSDPNNIINDVEQQFAWTELAGKCDVNYLAEIQG